MEAIRPQTLSEAWELGRQEGLTKVVFNMLQEGIDLDLIVKVTGLPLASIRNLQAEEIEENQTLFQDFMVLSETSLNEVWLNDEEEEAWKNL
jgi:hypothetical protein